MNQSLPESFQALFRQHYPIVLRKLVQIVGDRAIAEDLAQEAFLRLYRRPPDDLRTVGAWLHRVATRIAYDHVRKASRRGEIEYQDVLHAVESEPSSERRMLARYDRELVKAALKQLSERDRQVLLLRYSGYSYIEIAAMIGVSQELIGTMLSRALKRFKQRYQAEEGPTSEQPGRAQGFYSI